MIAFKTTKRVTLCRDLFDAMLKEDNFKSDFFGVMTRTVGRMRLSRFCNIAENRNWCQHGKI